MYLFASLDTKIFYIGKATPRKRAGGTTNVTSRYHLAAEIWKKMGKDGPLLFKATISKSLRRAIEAGEFLVVAIRIDPWQLSACVEAYLQAATDLIEGALPEANYRIG